MADLAYQKANSVYYKKLHKITTKTWENPCNTKSETHIKTLHKSRKIEKMARVCMISKAKLKIMKGTNTKNS